MSLSVPVLATFVLLLATAIPLTPAATAHNCNAKGHSSCNGHSCPDNGVKHDHYSRHGAWWDHYCWSTPAAFTGTSTSVADNAVYQEVPDEPIGVPKTICETAFDDTGTHVYGAPSSGFLITLGLDGAVPPCPYGDTTWDGHYEFAVGGAWLQAAASVCTDAYADHTPGSLIHVYDQALTRAGSSISFSVYSDTLNNNPVPEDPDCGDFESDYGVDCVDACVPGFPPGIDGSYQVYVSGTAGIICNTGECGIA